MIESQIDEKQIVAIVSGGAKGVDFLAKRFAEDKKINFVEFLPDYKNYGKAAPVIRNSLVVECSDKVIAFPSGKSRGTLDAIRKAKKAGKLLKVIEV